MKKFTASILLALLCSAVSSQVAVAAEAHASTTLAGKPLPLYVYETFRSPKNNYIPSGWMGDVGDIQFNDNYKAPNAKTSAIRVVYSAQGRQGNGWAGIYWQLPANNWGTKAGGLNLNGAKRLVFKARGEKGTEVINEFKMGVLHGVVVKSRSSCCRRSTVPTSTQLPS
jgi:hypothetical protein